MVDCIEQTGKALNLNNEGIVKYLCGIEAERRDLELIIQKQYKERKRVEAEIERLTYKLCLINKSLSMRIKAKNNYDKTIEEIKGHYERLVDSSNKLRQIVEKTQQDLDDIMNKKTGTGGPEGEEIEMLYVKREGKPGPDDCPCAYTADIPTREKPAQHLPKQSPSIPTVVSEQSAPSGSPRKSTDEAHTSDVTSITSSTPSTRAADNVVEAAKGISKPDSNRSSGTSRVKISTSNLGNIRVNSKGSPIPSPPTSQTSGVPSIPETEEPKWESNTKGSVTEEVPDTEEDTTKDPFINVDRRSHQLAGLKTIHQFVDTSKSLLLSRLKTNEGKANNDKSTTSATRKSTLAMDGEQPVQHENADLQQSSDERRNKLLKRSIDEVVEITSEDQIL